MRSARFLFLLPVFFLPFSSCAGPASRESKPDPEKAALLRLQEQGRLEEALRRVTQDLKKRGEDPGLWALKGKICYEIATRQEAAGLGGGYFEAAQALEKALSLGSREAWPRILLARILLKNGRPKEALPLAEEAASLAATPKEKAQACLEAGKAANGLLAELVRDKASKAAIGEAAKKALDFLKKSLDLDPDDAQGWIYLANTYAWEGLQAREIQVLQRALARLPKNEALHKYFQDRLIQLGRQEEAVGFLARMVREDPSNAVAWWYLGRARTALAESLREKAQDEAALEAYDQAVRAWEEAARLKPAFTSSSNQSIAMALVGKGWLLYQKGLFRDARKALVRAWKAWPGVFDKKDRFGVSYITAMEAIGKALLGGSRGFLSPGSGAPPSPLDPEKSLRLAVEHFRDLIARHKDRKQYLGWWYNNLGLALRDLGSLLARRGPKGGPPPKEAMKCWRESYQAYSKAVEIFPEDPRILNDCALILVYHLGEKLDHAEKLFRKAIRLGTASLKEKEEAGTLTEEERKFLEEAVGDAWQNLGLLYQKYKKDPEKALAFYRKAVAYYPYTRRAAARAARRLESLKGKTVPAAEKKAEKKKAPAWYPFFSGSPVPQEEPPLEKAKALMEKAAKASPGEAKGLYADAAYILGKLARAKGDAPTLLLLAKAYRGLAEAEKRRTRPNGITIQGNLDEAVRTLKKVLKLDESNMDALVLLVTLELERGAVEGAAGAARKIADLLEKKNSAIPPEKYFNAAAMAGHALYFDFAKKKAAGTPPAAGEDALAQKLLGEVLNEGAKNKGTVPGVPSPQVAAADLANLLLWKGDKKGAVRALGQWLSAAPADPQTLTALLGAARAGAASEAISVLDPLVKARPRDPLLLWYQGAVYCEAGDQARRVGNWDEARKDYLASIQASRSAARLRTTYAASAQQYIVRALSGLGYVARARKDPEKAAEWFLKALAENPALKDTRDALMETPARGILYVTDDLRSTNQPEKVLKAVMIYKKALEYVPNESTWGNNMGLFARDLGTFFWGRGKKDEAKKLFELSLWGYEKALAVEPNNPRLLNDTALILVYHLKRDLDRAEKLLKRAIREGTAQMKALGTKDPGKKQFLDEAVGDAWQNLGKLALLRKDLDGAEKAYKESLKHYSPNNRAEVRRDLKLLARIRAAAKKKAEGEGGGGGEGK